MKHKNTDWPRGTKSIQLAWLRWQWWAEPTKQRMTKREKNKKLELDIALVTDKNAFFFQP